MLARTGQFGIGPAVVANGFWRRDGQIVTEILTTAPEQKPISEFLGLCRGFGGEHPNGQGRSISAGTVGVQRLDVTILRTPALRLEIARPVSAPARWALSPGSGTGLEHSEVAYRVTVMLDLFLEHHLDAVAHDVIPVRI